MDSDLANPLIIDDTRWSMIMTQLNHDVNFFQSNGIMDYSLLVGVHDVSQNPRQTGKPEITSMPLHFNSRNAVKLGSDAFR